MITRLDEHEKKVLERKRMMDGLGEQIQSLQRRLADTEDDLAEKQAECERWQKMYAGLSEIVDSALEDARNNLTSLQSKIDVLELTGN